MTPHHLPHRKKKSHLDEEDQEDLATLRDQETGRNGDLPEVHVQETPLKDQDQEIRPRAEQDHHLRVLDQGTPHLIEVDHLLKVPGPVTAVKIQAPLRRTMMLTVST